MLCIRFIRRHQILEQTLPPRETRGGYHSYAMTLGGSGRVCPPVMWCLVTFTTTYSLRSALSISPPRVQWAKHMSNFCNENKCQMVSPTVSYPPPLITVECIISGHHCHVGFVFACFVELTKPRFSHYTINLIWNVAENAYTSTLL